MFLFSQWASVFTDMGAEMRVEEGVSLWYYFSTKEGFGYIFSIRRKMESFKISVIARQKHTEQGISLVVICAIPLCNLCLTAPYFFRFIFLWSETIYSSSLAFQMFPIIRAQLDIPKFEMKPFSCKLIKEH